MQRTRFAPSTAVILSKAKDLWRGSKQQHRPHLSVIEPKPLLHVSNEAQ
jgi:hypothetical protein